MPKKRSAITKSEYYGALEKSFERKARDFAFEAGFQLQVRGLEVFVQKDGQSELLCVADSSRHFWRTIWRAMTVQFPALKRCSW